MDSNNNEGRQEKCCLGLAYFNRTLERSGKAPTCIGLSQLNNGEQDDDDAKKLSGSTGDFQYYCIGYSSHPAGAAPSRPGQPTSLPFCEGIEIAVSAERVPAAAQPAGPTATATVLTGMQQQALRDRATSNTALNQHGVSTLPSPPGSSSSSADPASEDSPEQLGVRARFHKEFRRNVDNLRAAMTGEKPPQLPIQFKKYDSMQDARQAFQETASANLSKLRTAAAFISSRTIDVAKPIWDRFWLGSEEEAE